MSELKVEKTYTLNFGQAAWKIPADLILEFDGTTWVKLTAWNRGLCAFICDEIDSKQMPRNASLCSCVGFLQLKQMRNDALSKKEGSEQESTGAAKLFGGEANSQDGIPKRRKVCKAAKEDIATIMFELAAVADLPNTCITARVPARRNDDLIVPLEPNILKHIIEFIRHKGVSIEDLVTKGAYDKSKNGVDKKNNE